MVHLLDFRVELRPAVVGVQRRQGGVGIAGIVLGLEPIKPGDGHALDAKAVKQPERTDDRIVEVFPAALDCRREVHDPLLVS